jgi:predicted O-linked N-acetylglucosamine transferase (SPINDLY family)
LGVISGQGNDLPVAVQYFERAIAAQPRNPAAYINHGNALKQLRQPEAALASFDQAIALGADDAIAHYSRAEIYRQIGRGDEALAGYDRAVAINPGFFQGHFRRGVLLQELGQLSAAVAAYDETIRVAPAHADALAHRGVALFKLRQFGEAVRSYEQSLAIRPDQPAIYLFRGNALKELNRLEESTASYDQAIAHDPNYAEAYVNRGFVLFGLGRMDEALASYDRAIAIKPEYAEAYFNRAYLMRTINRFDAAAADYRKAAELAPDIDLLPGARLEASLQTCDWSEFDPLVAQVSAGILADRLVSHPFNLLAAVDSPSLQLRAAQIWVRHACPPDGSLGPIAMRSGSGKLRLGYFSADYRQHPTYHLLAELIEAHDRSRFDVVGFAFGPATEDEPRQRLMRSFDQFIDVQEKSDLDAAALARELEIDIAIDLGGYTYNSRSGIFALRAAPLQLNYLGYLGTLGASYIDYIVADPTVVTAQSEAFFTEKIIYLPDSFQVNDRKRRIAQRIFTRSELGLPASGCVFCCFNNSFKIQPETFASWMRILQRVKTGVLLLVAGDDAIQSNLRARATRHGVDPRRLIFGERLPPPEYLARYRAVDLFLDTLPYNAGATASDALWAGLPVLTLAGQAFAGRIAASLLKAIGLPELITTTRREYEDLAVALAENPSRLAQIREKLDHTRLTSPLFATDRFARHLEAAYVAIHERYLAGLAPVHIRL